MSCRAWQGLSPEQRGSKVEQLEACPRCTSWLHKAGDCWRCPGYVCGKKEDGHVCWKKHDPSLHGAVNEYCLANATNMFCMPKSSSNILQTTIEEPSPNQFCERKG